MGSSGLEASLINNVGGFRSIEELEEAFICCDSTSYDSFTVLDDSVVQRRRTRKRKARSPNMHVNFTPAL